MGVVTLRERLNYITFVSLLRKTIPVTSYTFRKRKREGEKKISSKEMGEKEIVFLKSDTSPLKTQGYKSSPRQL